MARMRTNQSEGNLLRWRFTATTVREHSTAQWRLSAWGVDLALSLGTLFLVELATLYLMDWWFPFQDNNPAVRFWPRLFRAVFMIQVVAYIFMNVKVLARLRVARLMLLWLAILTVRFLSNGQFEGNLVLYMSYFAYWVLIMWASYCLVVNGELSCRQISIVGAIMNVMMMTRMALYSYAGIWVGGSNGSEALADHITNSSYPLLWLTLMQSLEPSVPFTVPITILSAIAIVLTLKRGAFIALLFSALVYGIAHAHVNRRHLALRKVISIALIVGLAIGFAVWMRAGDMSARWSGIADPDDAGSGRGVFWALLAQHWLSADLKTQLVGFGPHSVYEYLGEMWFTAIPAHNDWLHLAHEFGAISVVALIGIFWHLIRSVPGLLRGNPKVAPAFCAALAVAMCVTLFDLFSYSTDTAFFSLTVAAALGSVAHSEHSRAAFEGSVISR